MVKKTLAFNHEIYLDKMYLCGIFYMLETEKRKGKPRAIGGRKATGPKGNKEKKKDSRVAEYATRFFI